MARHARRCRVAAPSATRGEPGAPRRSGRSRPGSTLCMRCRSTTSESRGRIEESWVGRAPASLGPRPSIDDPVLVHGDACAPNTLISTDGEWTGHVDLGDLGVGDRWADLAVASLSLDWNFGRGAPGGAVRPDGIDRGRRPHQLLPGALGPGVPTEWIGRVLVVRPVGYTSMRLTGGGSSSCRQSGADGEAGRDTARRFTARRTGLGRCRR